MPSIKAKVLKEANQVAFRINAVIETGFDCDDGNRASTRGNVVNIINERSDDIWSILLSGKAMRFRALGHDVRKGDQTSEIILADEPEDDAGTDR